MTMGRQKGSFHKMCRACKSKRAKYVFHGTVRTSGVTPRFQKTGTSIPLCESCISKPSASLKSELWKSCLDALQDVIRASQAHKRPGTRLQDASSVDTQS
jgi:hypothetical protein